MWARQDSNLHQTGYEPAALPLSYGPAKCASACTAYRAGWRAHSRKDILRAVRTIVLLLTLAALPVFADEVDLTRSSRRRSGEVPTLVLRAEGGNEFAPYGYAGGVVSWLAGPHNSFEVGAGGGFPGLQLGFTARELFGEGGQFLLAELSIAGNTRVNRGNPNPRINAQAAAAQNSLWSCLGLGFEQRGDIDLSIAADIVFTTADLTPHWAIHGGLGFGFF